MSPKPIITRITCWRCGCFLARHRSERYAIRRMNETKNFKSSDVIDVDYFITWQRRRHFQNMIGSTWFDWDGCEKVNMKFIIGNWKIIIIIFSLEKRSQQAEENIEDALTFPFQIIIIITLVNAIMCRQPIIKQKNIHQKR